MATDTTEKDTRSLILATGQQMMSRKGFSSVGLTEILTGAGVPKGSFYHYFASKDAFGAAMLEAYFEEYLGEIDGIIAKPGLTGGERVMLYFANWRESQGAFDCQGRCLAVKLGAEVSDLSESMRLALKTGTSRIIGRLKTMIEMGLGDGSIKIAGSPVDAAASLYYQWLGASVMVKIVRTHDPFETALLSTRSMLGMMNH
ncbi:MULTISPECIES: TetR/AcrR family transcriptional regulator [Gluconobacter]|uniref:TetR family transcriptional regulator n=1 Tax=Gluconobacter cerinus TaxID=38307 RepID=A0A1B6VHN2_9PROT|nr:MULTISPECIES: TetR/AcrR family transcriptional regulator [Gluconobacter]MBS1020227.1 TetR/AcrR family transcriptional regulator [Gluconobacter cerinus]MBS1063941.1 TetR/AcrR family transcriptional regulator [Gluconobacter wancherniae]MBS1069967.1 TetR/AcrR family transcriptional regulator [Gluconobacter cerinus]MBS1072717.1 TetR/AcrR family transcriptional regulator [Gluconobacter cerinus]MCP1237476.1 TetR/AcrR family transcriptional regulator [Gluconobacter kondonii]